VTRFPHHNPPPLSPLHSDTYRPPRPLPGGSALPGPAPRARLPARGRSPASPAEASPEPRDGPHGGAETFPASFPPSSSEPRGRADCADAGRKLPRSGPSRGGGGEGRPPKKPLMAPRPPTRRGGAAVAARYPGPSFRPGRAPSGALGGVWPRRYL